MADASHAPRVRLTPSTSISMAIAACSPMTVALKRPVPAGACERSLPSADRKSPRAP
jgi:hypothetical protein